MRVGVELDPGLDGRVGGLERDLAPGVAAVEHRHHGQDERREFATHALSHQLAAALGPELVDHVDLHVVELLRARRRVLDDHLHVGQVGPRHAFFGDQPREDQLVVDQVLAHARDVRHHGHALSFELRGGPDAGQQQEVG